MNMKKLVLSFLVIGSLASCGNSNNSATSSSPDSSSKQEATQSKAPENDPEAERGLELIASSDCLGCHKVNEQLVGPPYQQVAAKYKDSSQAILDTLSQRIIKGSSGHWGEAQMTPHPNLSKDSARAMVKYVLSLNE
jgi:cytochrome c